MRTLSLSLWLVLGCSPTQVDLHTDETDTDTDADTDAHWDPADFTTVWEIGPGLDYEAPSDAPWENLSADTLVRIHYREEPYRDKWVLVAAGTQDDPVVVTGVPDGDRLPVISGDGATTRTELDYWNEVRSVLKVGGSSSPSGVPSWLYIEQLDIRSAHPSYSFTDDSGATQTYSTNAASVHVEEGDHITIRDCTLQDSGNGLFAGSGATDLRVIGNQLYGNGIEDSIYEHNSYTEALGIVFEGNHYGPLREGARGNNLKDRSAGTVIRYNWIQSGNRQLDLVDSDHSELIDHPSYRTTQVYGNVLVEPEDAGNSQIVHYGGDSGDESRYRKGELLFFHNTVLSTRSGNTTLLRTSSTGEHAWIANNAVIADSLALHSGSGDLDIRGNWLPVGCANSFDGDHQGSETTHGNTVGTDPGLSDADSLDLLPDASSALLDAALELPPGAEPLRFQAPQPLVLEARPDDGTPDIGALER